MESMKKLIAGLLAGIMSVTTLAVGATAAEEEMPFTDVKAKKWYYPAVKTVWEAGIMEGKTETTFVPDEAMTRAQLVTILYRLSGATETGLGASLTFSDTKKNTWYSDYVGWAVKEEIVNGYPDNTFKPDAPILRQELSKLISEYIESNELDINGKVLAESFTDAAKHPKWAKPYIEDLRARGVVGGDELGNFNPAATATRAEVAMIITRLLPEDSGTDDPTPDPDPTPDDTSIKVYPDNSWQSIAAPADDPTPENIGTSYTDDEIGLMISEALRVDDNGDDTDTKTCGTGTHGGHEVKVVRTSYGTFAVFVTGDVNEEGRTKDEMTFFEITSNGCRAIFTDDFDHSNGSCVPNVLQGTDGIIYVILMNDAGPARLTLYTYDAKADTYTKDVQTRAFDVPSNQCHGYGYTQAVIDNHYGKIYAIFNGGDVPGYVAWFIYDIESATWEEDCYTINLDWRICYANAYPDGNGGFIFLEQRDALVTALGELLGVDFKQANGYLWDAIVLIHVPDAHKEEFTMQDVFTPDYSTTASGVKPYRASHYNTGASLLDTNGNLHVVYTTVYSGTNTMYYAVYDKDLKELRNDKITLTDTKNKNYGPALVEGKNGKVYILAVNTNTKLKEAALEIWAPSEDFSTLVKVCEPQTLKVKTTGATLSPSNIIVGSIRNASIIDGYVPIVIHSPDENNKEDYYYFTVKLPD